LEVTPSEAEAMRSALRRVVRNLDSARDLRLSSAEAITRNKAIILLGFACPVQLSPVTMADLVLNDVIEVSKGLDVLLHWDSRQAKQYVTIPPDPDPAVCPVRALRAWRLLARQQGRRGGRLFEELSHPGERSMLGQIPLHSRIATLIEKAIRDAGLRPSRDLNGYDLLPTYLKDAVAAGLG
jgi:hypothetical protein